MKSRDASATRALRLIRAAFLTKLKEGGGGGGGGDALDDAAAVAVLRKLAKMRRESIEMFEKGGRDDLVQKERDDLAVVEAWLPKMAEGDVVVAWAKEAVAEVGATEKKEAGKVVGALMKKHRGEVDGKVAKEIVESLLA